MRGYQRGHRNDGSAGAGHQSRSPAFQRPGDQARSDRVQRMQSAMNGNPQVRQLKSLQGSLNGGARQENRTGLPDGLKAGIETLSGHSLDDVKVHYNSDRPAQLSAAAYTQGTDIHVASGQERHLPHEAWHVVQQKQGRVRPTLQMKGGVLINDDTGLEGEADVMGARAALQRHAAGAPGPVQPSVADGPGIAQRMPAEEIKVGRWYEIEGVEGPRYLKTRRTPQGGEPSWEFHTTSAGARKGEAPLIIRDPGEVLQMVEAPPAATAPAWGSGVSDHKIFGLDGKQKPAVMAAIEAGYRCFDAAKTYGFSVANLVEACGEAGLARKDYKVVYKIGHGATQAPLDDVIDEALASLRYIDILMVHEATGDIAAKIRTINKYIARGLVKAGGLSNVSGFDIEEMDVSELRNMVMLQDSLETIKAERLAGPGVRAGAKLAEAGVEVQDSVYGLHTGVQFTPPEVEQLHALHVTEADARMIWAKHHGLGEVASSSNPGRIAENFQTPHVDPKIAEAVVALIDGKLNEPPAEQQVEAPAVWNIPALREIHLAATVNAQSNNLEAFIGTLNEIVGQNKGLRSALIKGMLPLKLQSHDISTNNIYQKITWAKLLSGDATLGNACNVSNLLQAIAADVKRIDDEQK